MRLPANIQISGSRKRAAQTTRRITMTKKMIAAGALMMALVFPIGTSKA